MPGPLVQNRFRGLGVAQDVALHVAHDVEGLAVDRLVFAEADGLGHGDRGRPEGRDDPELTPHVMRRRENAPEGRPTEHPRGAVRTVDPIGQVGPPAGDELEAKRRRGPLDVLLEPTGDGIDVDALDRLHGGAQPSLGIHGPSGLFFVTR